MSTQIFLIQGIKIHSVQVETSEKSMQNLSTPLKSKEFTKQQSLLNRAVADTQMDLGYSTQAIAERQSIIKEPSHEHTISIPQHSTQSAAAVEEANEISPLEEKHSQQTLPFFIFEDQNGTRSIYDILKKTYPTCVFANEDEIQSLMEQNKNLPIEIFYVKRFDDSFETFATLKHLVAQILKDHQNVHLTLIGASMQNDQIKLEEKMKQFEEALQSESFPNPQLKETKTISLRFKSMMGGKQILESNVEKNLLNRLVSK
ncbi:MAG: hypothetical protein HWD61_05055 [Parachlamydiaceae bacterium]|nr:MAG: hypothetical protein HWD61_05055 [Parachlamydiaceae bacterium]